MQTRLFIKTTLECGYKMTSIPNVVQIQMPCIYCCVHDLIANLGDRRCNEGLAEVIAVTGLGPVLD